MGSIDFCFTWGLLETHTMQKVSFTTQPLSGCNSGLNNVWQGVVKKKHQLLRFLSIFMSSVYIGQNSCFSILLDGVIDYFLGLFSLILPVFWHAKYLVYIPDIHF